MKRVRINALETGLVFKRNKYQKMLTEGVYWLGMHETVRVFNTTHAFTWPCEPSILLADEVLVAALYVIMVKEGEIALVYTNGLFSEVLTPGRYAYWKGPVSYAFVVADTSKVEITEAISREVLQHAELAPFIRTTNIEHYEKAVLLANEQYVKILEGGLYYWWKNSTVLYARKADMRLQQLDINGQEILTRDKAAVRMNAFAQYRVVDIEKALLESKEYEKQLYTSTLGIVITDFGIRDLILPGDVKEIMNQVLIADKKAQANSIMRREETASTRSLLNTAKLMEDNQMLLKLKEMEYVEKIADKINTVSVNGNGVLIDQLKQIFVPQK